MEKGRLLYESVIGHYVLIVASLVNRRRDVESKIERGRIKSMMVKMLNRTIVQAMKDSEMG